MNICLQLLYALAVVILRVGTDAGGVGFSLPVVVVQPGLYVCSWWHLQILFQNWAAKSRRFELVHLLQF